MTIFRQTGENIKPETVNYSDIIILKNGEFYTVDELNKMVKVGPFDAIETIKVNGETLAVTNKTVDISTIKIIEF